MFEVTGILRQPRDRIEHVDTVWVLSDGRPLPMAEDAYVDAEFSPPIEQLRWLADVQAAMGSPQ